MEPAKLWAPVGLGLVLLAMAAAGCSMGDSLFVRSAPEPAETVREFVGLPRPSWYGDETQQE